MFWAELTILALLNFPQGFERRAASTKKNFHVVEGSNHMQLYDVPQYLGEAVSVLAAFFKSNL
jgi:fermentation-respiration switch protein FrsA (DUF1100 family)